MITAGMNHIEIKRELLKEYGSVLISMLVKFVKYKRKIRKYGIRHNRTFATYKSGNKNNYLFLFTCSEEGIGFTMFCYYENNHGFNYLLFTPEDAHVFITFFTAHYLKRYRERMHLDSGLTPLEVVKKWSESHVLSSNPTRELPAKNGYQDRFCLLTSEGCSLGYQNKAERYLVMNTFVSNEMLKGNQTELSQEAMEEIRQEYELSKRFNDKQYWSSFLKKIGVDKSLDTGTLPSSGLAFKQHLSRIS